MTVSRCLSSYAMSELLSWRNPQGSEEEWLTTAHQAQTIAPPLKKIIYTELGLLVLAVAALVEIVADSLFIFLSGLYCVVSTEPFKFFMEQLQSSRFTLFWAVANALISNFTTNHLLTHESSARDFIGYIITPLSRSVDKQYVIDQDIRLRNIDHGKNFILSEVLEETFKQVDETTISRLKQHDYQLREFVIRKAMYIYIAGSKKDAEIPAFFTSITRESIARERLKLAQYPKDELEAFKTALMRPESTALYLKGRILRHDEKSIYNAGSNESRIRILGPESLFSRSFRKACDSIL